MFNRKLKAIIKELEKTTQSNYYLIHCLSESDSYIRQSISELDWKIKQIKKPVKTSETKDSKTFEYPYKYTFSDAKKEKEIPVDVRDKILNDYGKSLQRDFVFLFHTYRCTSPDAEKEKATNIFLDQEKQVLMRFRDWKRKNDPNSFVIATDLIDGYLKRNL
jgi:hypothetical protein